MTLSQFERQAFFLNLWAVSYPPSAPEVSLTDAVKIIEKLYNEKKTTSYVHPNGKIIPENKIHEWKEDNQEIKNNIIFIADLDHDSANKKITLLLNRGDAEVVNPAFVNAETQSIREVKKNDNEAMGYSAHLSIHYDESKKTHAGYRAVIERIPTLSKTTVFTYLRALVRDHAQNDPGYEFFHEKDKETKSFHPVLHMTNHKGFKLENDLKEGRITGIDLIQNKIEDSGIDKLPHITEVKKTLSMKVDHGQFGENAIQWLDHVRGKARSNGFDQIVVRVSDLPQQSSVSPRLATDMQDAAELLYARCELLEGFAEPLDQCRPKINAEIKKKLLSLLEQSNYWK